MDRGATVLALILGGSLGMLATGVSSVPPADTSASALSVGNIPAALMLVGALGWHVGVRWAAGAVTPAGAWPLYLDMLIGGLAMLSVTVTARAAALFRDVAHAWFVLPGIAGAVVDGASAGVAVALPAGGSAMLLRLRRDRAGDRVEPLLAALLSCIAVAAIIELTPQGKLPIVAMQSAALPCLIAACLLAAKRRDPTQSVQPIPRSAVGSLPAHDGRWHLLRTTSLLAIALLSALAARPPGGLGAQRGMAPAFGAIATAIGLGLGFRQSRGRRPELARVGLIVMVSGAVAVAMRSLDALAILKPGTLSAALGIGLRALVAFAGGAAMEAFRQDRASTECSIDALVARALVIGGLSIWLAGPAGWPVAVPVALGVVIAGSRLLRNRTGAND